MISALFAGAYARVIAMLVIIVLWAGSAWYANHKGYLRGVAEVMIQWQAEKIEIAKAIQAQESANRKKEQELAAASQKVIDEYAKTIKNREALISSLISERNGLRDALNRLRAAAESAAPAGDPNGAAVHEIAGQCITLVTELEAEGRINADRLAYLQQWVREVLEAEERP